MRVLSSDNLADMIESRSEFICGEWLKRVREQIPVARNCDDKTVINSLPKYLTEAVSVLRDRGVRPSLADTLATAREHGETRTRIGYFIRDVAMEYSLLREVIANDAAKSGQVSVDVLADLNRISDAGLINAVERFLEITLAERERSTRNAIEASKKQLEDFFMQAPEPMVIMVGPEHIFSVANEPYIRLIGRNPIGQRVRDVFRGEEAGDFFAILDDVFRTGVPFIGKELVFRTPLPNGELKEHWINIGYYPTRGVDGRIIGVHAFVHDVTTEVAARKTLEGAKSVMEHEQKNFENLFAQTPEMVCILDGPDHRFRFVNAAHIKILGFNATGMAVREAQPESVEVHGILDDVYSTGVTAELMQIPITVTDRLRYFNLTFSARRNLGGDIDGVMILGTEVTDQVLNLESLKLQGRALELSMADAPLSEVLTVMTQLVELQAGGTLIASVLLADKDEKHLYHGAAPGLPDSYNAVVNGIAIGPNIGSCGSAAFTKKRTVVTDIMHDPLWADFKDLAASYGLRACWSVPILSSSERLLGTFAFYSREPREPSARELEIVGVAAQTTALIIERRIEIEERQLAAYEAERANEAKSAFLANMSHEIRTPLGAIMGFADLAMQPDVTKSEIRNYLGIVERNSGQVLRIIDDILDIAKVEAGRVELELIEVSLTEFLAEFTSLVGFRARENGIAFHIRAETDLPDVIFTDPTRLRQILTNSVGNAIKFTKIGFVTLHVCFRDGLLEFGIEDTGRGISEMQSRNLFQAFVQADASTTRKFGGTGLGLVLTKRLCQLMGGDYVLERSELGIGSKFSASVRVKLPPAAKMTAQRNIVFETSEAAAMVTRRGSLEGVSVLLVEDSPDNQILIQLILGRQGAKVQIAADGALGVQKAMSDVYDVVLMDIQMPNMDGHEAVRILRERGYAKPIIALTAHAMREEVDRAKRSGFTSFLSKPIQRDALISTVSEFSGRPS